MIRVGTLILIFLQLFAAGNVPAAPRPVETEPGTLTGQLLDADGQPLPGGLVSLFDINTGPPPIFQGMSRVPNLVSRVGSEGKINIRIIPGSYYMGALKVTNPKRGPGPPRSGEKVYFAKDEKGELRIFTIAAQQVLELGEIRTAEPEAFKVTTTLFTVKGHIVDEKGAPYPKAVILVKTDLNRQRPDFISQNIDEGGRFQLQLPVGKYYFLMARQSSFSRPRPGDYIGIHGIIRTTDRTNSSETGPPMGIEVLEGEPPATNPLQGANPIGLASYGDIEPLPVSGKAGEVLENIVIIMTKLPDPLAQRAKILKKKQEEDAENSDSPQKKVQENKK